MKILIDTFDEIDIEKGYNEHFDKIVISNDTNDIEIEIGKSGISEFLYNLIWEYKKVYGIDELLDILNESDFEDVVERLVKENE